MWLNTATLSKGLYACYTRSEPYNPSTTRSYRSFDSRGFGSHNTLVWKNEDYILLFDQAVYRIDILFGEYMPEPPKSSESHGSSKPTKESCKPSVRMDQSLSFYWETKKRFISQWCTDEDLKNNLWFLVPSIGRLWWVDQGRGWELPKVSELTEMKDARWLSCNTPASSMDTNDQMEWRTILEINSEI